jgi:hypothetical protein
LPTTASQQNSKDFQDLCAILSQEAFLPQAPDYASLVDLAFQEQVAALLAHRLPRKDFPKEQADRLSQYLLAGSRISLLQTRAFVHLNRRLQEMGIRPIWLKGLVLAHTLYDAPHLRPMGDLDFLVPAHQYKPAIEAALALGYLPYETALERPPERFAHHEHLVDSETGLVHLEIHHRLLGYGGADYLPDDYLSAWMQNPSSFQIKGETFYCLPPEAHFLYLCAHAFLQHGEAHIKLRHLFDLDLVLRKQVLDWSLLLEMAVDLRWTYLLSHAMRRVQAYFQTPLPPKILEQLETQRPADENIDLVQRLEEGDIRAERLLRLLGQMSFAERVQAIRKAAFPPSDYMRHRYKIGAEKAVWPYYVYRWGDQVRGLLAALRKRQKK